MKIIKKILWIIKITIISILECLTNILPEGSYGDRARGAVLKMQLKKCGKKLKVSKNVRVINPKCMSVGNNVYIGYGVWINANYGVEVGNNTMLGSYALIVSGNHKFDENAMSFFEKSEGEKISIGSGCWIAGHAMVGAGVTIEDYCLVGANSVITKDVPKNTKVVGVNKVIGKVYETE